MSIASSFNCHIEKNVGLYLFEKFIRAKNIFIVSACLLPLQAHAGTSIGVYCWDMISTYYEPGLYDDYVLCLDLENKGNIAYEVTGYKLDNKTQEKNPIYGSAVFDEEANVYKLKFNGITVAEINPATLNGRYKSGALYGDLTFLGVKP